MNTSGKGVFIGADVNARSCPLWGEDEADERGEVVEELILRH